MKLPKLPPRDCQYHNVHFRSEKQEQELSLAVARAVRAECARIARTYDPDCATAIELMELEP